MLSKIANNFYSKYLLAILLIVGGYFVLFLFDNPHFPSFCFFKLLTGIPCPGCGMGRASIELFNGNIISSFNYNIICIPLTLSIFISLCWLLIDLFKRKETFFKFINRDIKPSYKVLLFAIIINDWTTNIIRQI